MVAASTAVQSQSLEELLEYLFNDEIVGQAIFERLLGKAHWLSPDQRWKIDVCRLLEAQTKRTIERHFQVKFRRAPRDLGRRREGEGLGDALVGTDWATLLQAYETETGKALAYYRELSRRYGAEEPGFCAKLTAHELGLRDFARDEVRGESGIAIARVLSLLDDRYAAQVLPRQAA